MMTGEQYRRSLRDGRTVFCQGRQIHDVSSDPLTKLSVDWVADGCDRHYQPAVGPYCFIPRSIEELRASEERQKSWDFPTVSTSTSLLMLLNASSRMVDEYPVYAERVLAFFDDAKRRDVRAVLTITDAKATARSPRRSRTIPTSTCTWSAANGTGSSSAGPRCTSLRRL
jgi:4-hydroxybutyryl-CoA dehydratase/vinylacetyl-CoA-Delta-isomerase